MSNSISDITVNVKVSDVIYEAEFGVPLLYVPTASKSVEYTECYDLSEVRKATAAIYGGSVDYTDGLEDLTGGSYTASELSEEIDKLGFASGAVYTIEEVSATYGSATYEKRLEITNVNYITLTASRTGLMRVICAAGSTNNAVVVVRKGSVPSTASIVSSTTVTGDTVNSIVIDVESGQEYCIFADTTTPFKLYAVYVDVPSAESTVIVEQAKRIFGAEVPPEKVAVLCCPIDSLPDYESYDWRQIIYNGNYSASSIQNAKAIAEYIEYFENYKLFYFECGTALRTDLDFAVLTPFERTIIGVSNIVDSAASPILSALIGATSTKPVGS